MLAVVDDEQVRPGTQRRDEEREVVGASARLAGALEDDGLAQVEGGQERRQDAVLVAHRRELDERCAAPVGGLPRPADLRGQPGLAGATGTDHRRQPAAGEHPDDPLGLGLSPEEAGQPGAQPGASADGWLGAGDVLAQQRQVELAQRGGGVGAEGVREGAPEPLVGGQRLRGAAGGGQGAHQLAGELLAKGVRAGAVLELGDHVGGVTQSQVRVDPGGEGVEPLLVEPGGQRDRVLAVVRVGEGRSAPQVEGLGERRPGRRRVAGGQEVPTSAGQPSEPLGVDGVARDGEPVALVRLLDHGRVAQGAAQPGDQRLEGADGVGGRVLAPDRVDELAHW